MNKYAQLLVRVSLSLCKHVGFFTSEKSKMLALYSKRSSWSWKIPQLFCLQLTDSLKKEEVKLVICILCLLHCSTIYRFIFTKSVLRLSDEEQCQSSSYQNQQTNTKKCNRQIEIASQNVHWKVGVYRKSLFWLIKLQIIGHSFLFSLEQTTFSILGEHTFHFLSFLLSNAL